MAWILLPTGGCISPAPESTPLDSGTPAFAADYRAGILSQPLPAPPLGNLQPNKLSQDANAYIGTPVLWGGVIVGLANQAGGTRMDVRAYPLRTDGRPDQSAPAIGRFAAVLGIPFDPKVYASGRQVTVSGAIDGSVNATGDTEGPGVPLVRVAKHFVWGRSDQPAETYRALFQPRPRDGRCRWLGCGRCRPIPYSVGVGWSKHHGWDPHWYFGLPAYRYWP